MIDALRKFVRKRRDLKQVDALLGEWRALLDAPNSGLLTAAPTRDILLIPPEPISLVGSKGDEAMLVSVISTLASAGRQVDIAVGAHWKALPPVLVRAGAGAMLPIWDYSIDLTTVVRNMAPYREIVLIGADVMDGYYSASKSFRFFMIADLATRFGKRSSITGFSFNNNPAPSLQKLPFKEFSQGTRLCLRDPVSLDRFGKLSCGLGRLTADVAFLLQPDEDSSQLTSVRHWASCRRDDGEFVLGFNIHPALLPDNDAAMAGLVSASISALRKLLAEGGLSVLFISHDARATSSDSLSIKPVFDALKADFDAHVHLIEADRSAAELKAVAGLADAVFTGRMHLSIAALGMGVPVAWATYQGKFEGLAKHFNLPDWLLIEPSRLSGRPELLEQVLRRIVNEQDSLKSVVGERLLQIKELSRDNLSKDETAKVAPR